MTLQQLSSDLSVSRVKSCCIGALLAVARVSERISVDILFSAMVVGANSWPKKTPVRWFAPGNDEPCQGASCLTVENISTCSASFLAIMAKLGAPVAYLPKAVARSAQSARPPTSLPVNRMFSIRQVPSSPDSAQILSANRHGPPHCASCGVAVFFYKASLGAIPSWL